MLGRSLAREPDPFQAVTPWLKEADVAVGNLECVIAGETGAGLGEGFGPFALRAPPSAASSLRAAGFDLMGLANNHALDIGSRGLAHTVASLQGVGVEVVGAGASREDALRPFIWSQARVRVAFLAFNGVPDEVQGEDGVWMRADWRSEEAVSAVAAAREKADAVVVLVHWGYEYHRRPDPAQQRAADLLLQAGADLIVGHHPHVVQELAVDQGACVAYSLGNFVSDQGGEETGRGMALRAFFDPEGLRAVQALPVVAGPRPRLMTLEEGEELLARVRPGPPRVGFVWDGEGCRSTIVEAEAGAAARFWGGRVDLIGDGVDEHVRLVGQQVVIYEKGAEVWRTPAEWHVVDVALGDPNQDGRSEMVLALWKPGLDGLERPSAEKEQALRSRPFIVGYRGGAYRTLWGGSAVEHPILEIELGDVIGDQEEELIVLEGGAGQQRTVSIWRWHGWGFSLLWRSDADAYRELALSADGMVTVAVD